MDQTGDKTGKTTSGGRSGVILKITGRIDMDSFFDFCHQRSERLDLAGRFHVVAPDEVRIHLTGAPDLVDMFEMACWLGPRSAMVDRIQTSPLHFFNQEMSGFSLS